MKTFSYKTSGTCSRSIELEIEGDVIVSGQFIGGCPGNTQGIGSLVRGMKVKDAIERMKGIRCGARSTSCPDQMALALEAYLAENN